MSKSPERAQTPAWSIIRNTTGKGSKQATDGPPGFLSEDRPREIFEKHYNQLLPIMEEKTKEKTQLSELESCDKKRRTKKTRSPSPYTMSRSTRLDRSPGVFSRLRQEESSSTCQRSPVSTTMFTRLGAKDKNVFTRLRERKKDVHSRLGPKVASRHKHASDRRHANLGRSAEDPNHRRKEARNLVRSYVTFSSERQREIEREWDAADGENHKQPTRTEEIYLSKSEHERDGHWKSKSKKQKSIDVEDLSQPWLCEEIDPFTPRIRSARVWFETLPPESIDSYVVLRKVFLENFLQRKKYIKDPVEIHHIKQKERESTEAFMERFKAESMHVNGIQNA
ncbi:reverse transcriptase domain-containing protein [Tanacetum coccineum]